jgi:hypothetical protein
MDGKKQVYLAIDLKHNVPVYDFVNGDGATHSAVEFGRK